MQHFRSQRKENEEGDDNWFKLQILNIKEGDLWYLPEYESGCVEQRGMNLDLDVSSTALDSEIFFLGFTFRRRRRIM